MQKNSINNLIFSITRILTIFVIVNVLFYSIDGSGNFFDSKTLKHLLYIVISLIIYHFFVKRILTYYIKDKDRYKSK